MFTQALSGMDSDFSVSKRIAYGAWLASLLGQQSDGMSLVSVDGGLLPARWQKLMQEPKVIRNVIVSRQGLG